MHDSVTRILISILISQLTVFVNHTSCSTSQTKKRSFAHTSQAEQNICSVAPHRGICLMTHNWETKKEKRAQNPEGIKLMTFDHEACALPLCYNSCQEWVNLVDLVKKLKTNLLQNSSLTDFFRKMFSHVPTTHWHLKKRVSMKEFWVEKFLSLKNVFESNPRGFFKNLTLQRTKANTTSKLLQLGSGRLGR